MRSSNAKLQHILSVIVNNRQVEHFLDCNLLVDNFGDPTLEAIFLSTKTTETSLKFKIIMRAQTSLVL